MHCRGQLRQSNVGDVKTAWRLTSFRRGNDLLLSVREFHNWKTSVVSAISMESDGNETKLPIQVKQL
jgi:hypothetical protein